MAGATKTAALTPAARLDSLDAYRGLVMIALAADGFGIARTARNFPESSFWQVLGYEFSHVQWVGCAFWDLIQPSFMFMVGVSLPYSCSARIRQGHSGPQLFSHAVIRAVVLIFLGIFLRSQSGTLPNFMFVDVLTQIGLGYVFLFLLWNRPAWMQLLFAQVILIGYWAWFALRPVPPEAYDVEIVNTFNDYLPGFAAHWQMHLNPAATFDQWFMNLFPREKPFVINSGGYATLNFIPALATMIFGLMTGEAIRSSQSKANVVGGLLLCAVLGLASGWLLNYFGICPLVKKLWTPGWTLFSAGWCWLMLAGFVLVIDLLGFENWAFPLKVAGMNSIALYVMGYLARDWTAVNLQRWFSPITRTLRDVDLFELCGKEYSPLLRANLVLLCFWLFVYWLYRQKIFLRI